MLWLLLLGIPLSIIVSLLTTVRIAKKHGDIGKGKIYGWFTFLGCIIVIWVIALLIR